MLKEQQSFSSLFFDAVNILRTKIFNSKTQFDIQNCEHSDPDQINAADFKDGRANFSAQAIRNKDGYYDIHTYIGVTSYLILSHFKKDAVLATNVGLPRALIQLHKWTQHCRSQNNLTEETGTAILGGGSHYTSVARARKLGNLIR